MTGGTRIIAFGGGDETAQNHADTHSETAADTPAEGVATIAEAPAAGEGSDWDAASPRVDSAERLPAALAIGAAAVWTGLFIWLKRDSFAALSAAEWPGLIGEWTLPVVLICAIWLLAMRHSRREAKRFGHVARLLTQESTLLESRLTTVNGELSLAREFIAAQSRDLEAVGRLAAERLSQNAERLQALIRENDARVAVIGSVSDAALENMEKLRGQLPVIASSTKDVTNNIGAAGRAAQAQLNELIDGFTRLNDFGQASERQVSKLRSQVEETFAEFTRQGDALDSVATARFAALAERGSEFRTQLDNHEVAALAALRNRASAMAEEFEQTRQQLDGHEAESLTSLRARLTGMRDESAAIARAMRDSETRAADSWRDAASQMQETIAAHVAALHAGMNEVEARQQARAAALTQATETMHAEMATIEEQRLSALQSRIAALGTDSAAQAQAFEQAETHALSTWKSAIERLSEDLRGVLATMEMADVDAAQAAQARFAALSAESDNLESALTERQRAFDAERDRRRAASLAEDEQTIALLANRLAALDAQLAERRASHDRESAAFAERVETIGARLDQFERRIADITAHGGQAEQQLGASLEALAAKLSESGAALSGTDRQISALTDSSVRLLELLQASAHMTHDTLPRSIETSEERLTVIEHRAAELDASIGGALQRGEELSSYVRLSGADLTTALTDMDALQAKLRARSGEQGAVLSDLRAALSELETQSDRLAQQARGELTAGIDALTQASQAALGGMRAEGAAVVGELAGRLGQDSAAAIERAMKASAADASGQLEQAAAKAADVAREAATQLREQLVKVDELTGNLERRVAEARQQAEEQVDSDFTRRVALLTESLNSNAIDIAKALSTDVSDVAWSAYLRGDRGIFTRRAVKLLEAGEAKAIAQLYETDEPFRDTVRRFIHDFEAILRQVLSSRDGHALGVTLLSSDMGKLYVSLAQAIERLR